MKTRPLTRAEKTDLQPATDLWRLYRPEQARHRFQACDPAEAERWQRRTRKALLARIGFQDLPAVAPAPRLLERVDKGSYVREKILLRTSPRTVMPVYILLPKEAPRPLPVVLALHGHGYGVKDIVGLWEDGAERDAADGYHKDFAVALCRRGFAVAAPEISCFGERQTDFSHLDGRFGQPVPYCCTHTAMLAFHLGGSVVGLRVHDGRCLVDYLGTRADVDCRRLGAMGISGGGMHTFFSTACDERIRACVVSGYYCNFKDSILAMHHCACNFVPGLDEFGEIYDLVGLIAPRPMLIEAGTRDPIFPLAGVKAAVARGNQVYKVFDGSRQIAVDCFEGRHQVSGAKAYDFLWEQLK
ncbi:MAG: Abhydrolase family protein [Lentisphaerae bacterium ADurb.BinA184]|nr:MAG: Abhydrolase family protein [Lentisphaerae bacterium ADurb.BinA184]